MRIQIQLSTRPRNQILLSTRLRIQIQFIFMTEDCDLVYYQNLKRRFSSRQDWGFRFSLSTRLRILIQFIVKTEQKVLFQIYFILKTENSDWPIDMTENSAYSFSLGDEADGIRSYRTPERIELENIRMSMIDDPQELPEEDVTKHNLVGGEITLKEEESIRYMLFLVYFFVALFLNTTRIESSKVFPAFSTHSTFRKEIPPPLWGSGKAVLRSFSLSPSVESGWVTPSPTQRVIALALNAWYLFSKDIQKGFINQITPALCTIAQTDCTCSVVYFAHLWKTAIGLRSTMKISFLAILLTTTTGIWFLKLAVKAIGMEQWLISRN